MANYEVVLGRCEISCNEMEHGVEEGDRVQRRVASFFGQWHKKTADGIALQGWMAVAPRSRAICKASLAMTVAIKLEWPSDIALVYDESFKHRAPAALGSRQIEMSGITFSPRQ